MRPVHRVALGSLAMLSGSRWLLVESFPSTLPTLMRDTAHAGALTLVFAAASRFRPPRLRAVALPAACVFTLPSLAFVLAEGHITPTTETVVFAFTPAVVAFALTQQTLRFGPESGYNRLLVPSFAGVLGLMLLLPTTLPVSLLSYARLAFLLGAMIGAGLGAIRLHSSLRGSSLFSAAALSSALTTLVLGIACLTSNSHWSQVNLPREAILTLALDAPILLLTLYLVRELDPVPVASRFLLIPLIAIGEGLLMLRPHPTPAMAAGLLLLSASVLLLLRSSSAEPSNPL